MRPEFRYTETAPRLAAGRSSRDFEISAPRFALPGELTQPSVVLASFSGKKEPVRPNEGTAQQAAAAATTLATSTAQAPAAGAPAPTPATGKYTGEPISVNLKDVDLRDFFRLIHEISGLNVVLDPAVKGSLTIVLDEVPWDQALDIVLQNNSLDKQLNGNVLRIATRATLKTEAETQRDLEKAQAEAVAPVTTTRVLSYAKAAAVKDTLKKFLSSRGDILSDDRSNQLIIRDIPSVFPSIDNLIRALDRKAQQVEIEARVVSASRSFASDIGTQLGFAGSTTSGRTVVGGDSTVGTSTVSTGPGLPPPPLVSGASTTAPALPLNVNLGAGAPTSGLFLGHRSPNFAVDFFITAAESRGVGKLLSKPKIFTQNNERAIIKQGTKIPIQTTINNTISVQFIDAVLKLEVTPQITAEGTIFMAVLVENTQIDAGIPRVQGIPALNTQSAETNVLVADGGTVVIGGIITSSQRVDITQVPLVGSLPLIGHLFKRTSTTTQSQELFFFLTPRIIPG
jgi:type IV pilus assembly protein PilQ